MAQAVLMYERGEASARDIDVAMKLGTGVPMVGLLHVGYGSKCTQCHVLAVTLDAPVPRITCRAR